MAEHTGIEIERRAAEAALRLAGYQSPSRLRSRSPAGQKMASGRREDVIDPEGLAILGPLEAALEAIDKVLNAR